MSEARNWKLVLAYDGTAFHGWQVQPHLPTVQGALSDAVARITGERVLPQGSGRTDTGVHALAQVASFLLTAPVPPENLWRALNRALPESIRVLSAQYAPADFHARHSATGKSYEYRIFRGELCPPWLARYAYALNWPLDLAAMQHAASLVVGEHDFTSFAATDPDLSQRTDPDEEINNIRRIDDSCWREEGDLLTYHVRGTGFLHHMVRNLVGTFLQAGRGAIDPEHIVNILAMQDRRSAGPTAPARGLFLAHVEYGGADRL